MSGERDASRACPPVFGANRSRIIVYDHLLRIPRPLLNTTLPSRAAMEAYNLKTASTYLNNLLLARGLLRDGKPVEFAHPSRGEGGKEATMSQIINLVHDLILKRDVRPSRFAILFFCSQQCHIARSRTPRIRGGHAESPSHRVVAPNDYARETADAQ